MMKKSITKMLAVDVYKRQISDSSEETSSTASFLFLFSTILS